VKSVLFLAQAWRLASLPGGRGWLFPWGGLRACRGSARAGLFAAGLVAASAGTAAHGPQASGPQFDWQPLPPLPAALGVAGPFVGLHQGAIVVAGGANFAAVEAADLWTVPKQFHAAACVLTCQDGLTGACAWHTGYTVDRPVAYGSSASTPAGVVCVGGEDGRRVFADAFLLTWDPVAGKLAQQPLPRLPGPSTGGGAAVVGSHVYVVAGQAGLGLDSATNRVWRLDLAKLATAGLAWEPLPPMPGGPRAFPIVVAQRAASGDRLYVVGGRRQQPGTTGLAGVEPLADCHEFSPERFGVDPAGAWRRRAAPPVPLMAGTAVAFGQRQIVVLAADDGALLKTSAADPEFAKRHPGFPRQAWTYDTVADSWESAGETPTCPVTTPAVAVDGGAVLVSGEVRPRVRTREVWRVRARAGGAGGEVGHD